MSPATLSPTGIATVLIIVGMYMLLLLFIGWLGYRATQATPSDYFLANGSLGPLVLTFTTFSTIFSALTFLGAAGFGYSFGAGWFMAQGTGNALLAITLFLVGHRVWILQQRFHFLTPAEMLSARFNSPRLRDLFTVVFFVATIPYLAIQPIGAGYVFSGMTGGLISFRAGATLIMVIMVAYVLLGGLRSVAWTDVVQGLMLLIFIVLALGVVVTQLGGFGAAGARIAEQAPELFTRPGGSGFWTERNVLSWWLIFVSNVAVQPVVLLRFMSARSLRTLKAMTIAWPFLAIVVTFMSTFIGLFGRALVPDLAAPDQIVPTLLAQYAPLWLATLILSGALAAMMSTGDSLLHYVGASATGDVYQRYVETKASDARLTWVGRIAILIVTFLGWLIALNPPDFIVNLGAATFTAIGVLMPAVLGILYWRRCTEAGVFTSIILAEIFVLGQQFKLLPAAWTFGFQPILTGLILAGLGLVAGSLLSRAASTERVAATERYFKAVEG